MAVGTDGARDRKNWRRGGPRDVVNLGVVSALNVEPADLITFSNGHREVGGQIDAALDADFPVVVTMPAAYGTVGAVFAAAVDGFEAALQRTGAALAGEYRRVSEALEVASTSYVRTDQVTGAGVARSGVIDDAAYR
jgi:hypothetical protein